MRRVILIVFAAMSLNAMDVGFYTGFETAFAQKSDKTIKGVQPSDELVGDGSFVGDIRLGAHFSQITRNLDAKAYTIIYGKSSSNSEIGGGVGVEVEYRSFDLKNLGFILGLDYRYGRQDTAQNEKTISSHIIPDNRLAKGSSTIEFKDDTKVSSSSLYLGAAYHFTKNISVDLAYVLRYEMYDVSYKEIGTGEGMNVDWSEYKHGVRLGLNFYF
ncbi:MAG: hypothetical protein LBS39_00580 [Campylobacteraceae bacterium]|jgi:opacity protein-like surface antigen|nr:hypothetical protein [Campylobacteraceae bacterium]